MKSSEDDVRRMSNEAASLVAGVFLAQGWGLKGVDGVPSQDQIADAITELFGKVSGPPDGFLPDIRRDRLRVELLPDLEVGHVWLRVGDIFLKEADHTQH